MCRELVLVEEGRLSKKVKKRKGEEEEKKKVDVEIKGARRKKRS